MNTMTNPDFGVKGEHSPVFETAEMFLYSVGLDLFRTCLSEQGSAPVYSNPEIRMYNVLASSPVEAEKKAIEAARTGKGEFVIPGIYCSRIEHDSDIRVKYVSRGILI